MKLFTLALLSVCAALPGKAAAQTPQPPATIAGAPNDSWILEWDGVAGRTYFVQVSNDLQTWVYAPLIEYGTGSPIVWGLNSSDARFYVKVVFTDQAASDPNTADFDGDGLPNLVEVSILGTDPFVADSAVDTDSDGLYDPWEIHYFGNISLFSGSSDSDGDGAANSAEFTAASSPLRCDTDADGLLDGFELAAGLAPLVPAAPPVHPDTALSISSPGFQRF